MDAVGEKIVPSVQNIHSPLIKMTVRTMRTLLIDGDIVVYQVAAAAEVPIHWGDGLWTLHADENSAIEALNNKLLEYKEILKADNMVVALSDKVNFRYSVYGQYKSNRKNKRQPMLREQLKQYVLDYYDSFLRPGLEGDDVLGILATSDVIIKADEKIIVSEDKDMRTIPCLFVNMRTYKESGVESISTNEAAYWHMYQTLTGDTADGFPGCAGCGPVTAKKILGDDPGEWTYEIMWPKVVKAYVKKKLGEEFALQMARVARICQRDDYDFQNKEVILWSPPEIAKQQ